MYPAGSDGLELLPRAFLRPAVHAEDALGAAVVGFCTRMERGLVAKGEVGHGAGKRAAARG